MKDRLKLLGITWLFWICFFVICRIIFLLFHADQTSLLTFREIATILLLGLRMDLAMAAYWSIVTALLISVPGEHSRILYRIQNSFVAILLLISVVIVVVDLELYSHWGFRMNRTPLFYMSAEAIGSVNPGHLLTMILIFSFLFLATGYFYFRFIAKKILFLKPLRLSLAPVMLIIGGLLFIPIRSRFTVAPLNTGVVYFHKTKSFPNHAGINVVWNFFNSLSATDDLKYPDHFYAERDPDGVLRELVRSDSSTTGLLRSRKPNIILIILESFTSNIIAPLGGAENITPELNKLISEGILFDHFYASGDRTDKGLVAILSSYPSQPETSIIRFPQKTENLPYLSRVLEKLSYHTSFVYGGDIGFANMESYVTSAGFGHVTADKTFDKSLDNSKWGVADHYVFNQVLVESDTATHPFFKVMLSLSSHEPFEVPMEPVFKGDDERTLFLNACRYVDKSLGEFIASAKQKPWWKETLVIITADHGHRFPNAQELQEKERFKIPMLWLGGALATKDSVIHTIGGQTDIVNTLLAQIDSTHPEFRFSKNILGKNVNPFAVYVFNKGFGYVDPEHEYIYDFDARQFNKIVGNEDAISRSKAYMQALFNDYNNR
jgi:phosphoglycerol transferase MdoB-like AlkP superfamily enzyme